MKRRRVLVVDDEVVILMHLQEVFEAKGWEVEVAESGEEAMEYIKSRSFDAMVLDLRLPGMDGLELCRRAKALQPEAVSVAVTGYPSLFEAADCRAAGFDAYLIKPVGVEKIIEAVDKNKNSEQ